MAKQILATSISTVVVEQECSVDDNILNTIHFSLSLDSIQTQTCLDDWTKAQYRQHEIPQEPTYEYFKNDQMRTEVSDD